MDHKFSIPLFQLFNIINIIYCLFRITRKYTQDANIFLKRPLKILGARTKVDVKISFEIYLLND